MQNQLGWVVVIIAFLPLIIFILTNKNTTAEIFQGTIANARELKNISERCKFHENRTTKEPGIISAKKIE